MNHPQGNESGKEEVSSKRPLALMLTADRQIDRRILLEADALEEDGWAVKIIAMPLDGDERKPDSRVVRLGISARSNAREFYILKLYRKVRGMMPMNSFLMRRLKAFVWAYFVDQEKFYVDLFLSEALRHPATVVIAHDLPMLPVGTRYAKATGVPVVYDSHELFTEQEFGEQEKRRWRSIEEANIRAAEAVITVNQSISDELKRRYELDIVHVILNAERPLSESPQGGGLRSLLCLGEEAIIGLFQGGLSGDRNLDRLLEGMQFVTDQRLHLVFLGDGQMASSLARRAVELNLSDRVHFLSAVPQAELLALTTSADFGIIPYQATCLNSLYCTPNKLFEFISAAVPIMASDLPELRRFVHGNGLGIVADLSTARSMGDALTRMASDGAFRRRCRDQLKAVRKILSWEVEGPKFAALLRPHKKQMNVN